MVRRPGIRQQEMADILGYTRGRISQVMSTITEEWKNERLASFEIDLTRRLREIEGIKKICKDRLKRCAKPETGSRWVEMHLKAISMEAKILGLNAPDIHEIRAKESITKEERDAAAVAMMKQIAGANGLQVSIVEENGKETPLEKVEEVEETEAE